MNIIQKPSPNFDERSEGVKADLLVMHYTGMKTGKEAIERLCDPEAKVSSHYVVEEDGRIFQLVDENKRAWHAGISSWGGREKVNDFSIGVEIVNPGHEFGYRPFPAVQMQSVVALCKEIVARHKIEPKRVVGHSDIAPARKEDPGELFDWGLLARNGVGLFPEIPHAPREPLFEIGDRNEQIARFQAGMAEFGYSLKADGLFGTKTEFAVRAFQRHFDPMGLSGVWTNRCDAILAELLTKM